MSNTSRFSALSFHKQSSPGLAEIQPLLDLLPWGVLLVATQDNRILLANSKATELTAYTRAELIDLNLKHLFPSLIDKTFLKKLIGRARYWDIVMTRHGGSKVEVQITPTALDAQSKWVLVALEPVEGRELRLADLRRQQQLWSAHETLANAPQQENLDTALHLTLQAGSAMTSAAVLVVFQADGKNPILHRLASYGSTELLPDHLTSQDLTNLQTPTLWTPGRRSASGLHRMARTSNLSYVASAPLGQSNALIGLVVIAGCQISPSDTILPTLNILATHLTTIIQGRALTTNLSRILEEQQKYINLGTIIKDAAQDSIIIISPDLTILDMNPSAELTLGYACREVKGHPVENILIGAEILIPTLMAVQHEGYTYNLGNITLYRRDGRSFLAQIRAAPLTDSEHLESWILLIQDLSQEEQLRNRTQQLEQRALLGELMAVFAHEVRNPINNISTGLQLMAINIPAEDPNQEVIARLQQDCDRLDHQMKSVLSFARPIEYKMEPVDLGVMMQRLLDRWRLHLTRAKVQSHLQVVTDLPPTHGDIRALEQVFTNLITNAIQAMSDHGGTLALKIQPIMPDGENEQIEVSVSDTGIGIPEENRDRIFEPFFTTGKNGTGLGLAITKRIVIAHKGTIKFDSVPGGTIFQVRLPAVKPQSVSEVSE